jgi:NAD(P)-dependent dehydrogenase (short-subunit alcohol dehydrogenase family)
MSKRGLVAYSDALRLEHGDAITVTTVYPGYIRTGIHAEAAAVGLALEGAVPAERVQDAARAIARAALGPPRRDMATTRAGAVGYALARAAPRPLLDRVVRGRMGALARRGHFGASELAAEFARRAAGVRR